MQDNSSSSPSKKKLIAQFRKRDPTLTDEEISRLLNSTRRFVELVRKIRNEPQVQISYKDVSVEKGKGKIKNQRFIKTSIEELSKVFDKPSLPISDAFRKLSRFVDKNKHGK